MLNMYLTFVRYFGYGFSIRNKMHADWVFFLFFTLLQLFDWSKMDGASKNRLLTFYRLADNIANKLKGLFVLFAGQLVKPISELLHQLNISHTGSLHISICLYEVPNTPAMPHL